MAINVDLIREGKKVIEYEKMKKVVAEYKTTSKPATHQTVQAPQSETPKDATEVSTQPSRSLQNTTVQPTTQAQPQPIQRSPEEESYLENAVKAVKGGKLGTQEKPKQEPWKSLLTPRDHLEYIADIQQKADKAEAEEIKAREEFISRKPAGTPQTIADKIKGLFKREEEPKKELTPKEIVDKMPMEQQVQTLERYFNAPYVAEGVKAPGVEKIDRTDVDPVNLADPSTIPGYLINKAASGFYSPVEGLQQAQQMLSPQTPEGLDLPISKGEAIQKAVADKMAEGRMKLEEAGEEHPKAIRRLGSGVEGAAAMVPTMLLNVASGGMGMAAAGPQMGLALMGAQAAGNSYSQARSEGASHNQALAYGIGSGLLETGIEKLFGGIPGTKGVADSLTDSLVDGIKRKGLKWAASKVFDWGGEALEEQLTAVLDPALKKLTYDKNAPGATFDEIIEAGISGMLVSVIMGTPVDVVNAVNYARASKDIKSAATKLNKDAKNILTGEYAIAELNPDTATFEDVQNYADKINDAIKEKARELMSAEQYDLYETTIDVAEKASAVEMAQAKSGSEYADINLEIAQSELAEAQKKLADATEKADVKAKIKEKPAQEKSPIQAFDEAISKQQDIVDDFSYRKLYLEEDVDKEMETEMIRLQELKDAKEQYIKDVQAREREAQRSYDYESGNIPIQQLMAESEVRKTEETLPIQAVEQVETERQDIIPKEAEPVIEANRQVQSGKEKLVDIAKPTEMVKRENVGEETKVYDNDNNEYKAIYAVVDVNNLIASHDTNLNKNSNYPQELQPRERERAAYRLQIDRMAYDINPELLGDSPRISDGAPIIGDDNIVESGNGRVIALKKMYKSTKSNKGKYTTWLKNNAEKFGINPDNLPDNPVLVRVRQTDVDRAEFTKKANEPSVVAMSSTETAKADSTRLSDKILGLFVANDDGIINSAANRQFISAFMDGVVPKGDAGRHTTPDGYLSQDGLTRLRNAIFYKAYGSEKLLARIAESTDNNIKNITNALINIASRTIEIKNGIRNGSLYNVDFSTDITGAVEKYIELKANNTKIDEYLNQFAMFSDDTSKESKYILSAIEEYRRSAKKLREYFNRVFDSIEALGSPNQVNMFGESHDINKLEILDNAYLRGDGDYEQGTIEQVIWDRPQEIERSSRVSETTDRSIETKEGKATEGKQHKTIKPSDVDDAEISGYAPVQEASLPKSEVQTVPAPSVGPAPVMAKGDSIEVKYSDYIKGKKELPSNTEVLKAMLEEIESETDDAIKVNLQQFAKKIKKQLSKVYSNTFVNSGIAAELGLDSNDFEYVVKSETEQLEEAHDRINTDRKGEIDRILNAETFDYNDVNISMEILNEEMSKPENERDYELIKALSPKTREAGTFGGRIVQAYAKYTRTPAEVLDLIQRGANEVEDEFDKKSKDRFKKKQETKDFSDGIDKAEKDATKHAVDEFFTGHGTDYTYNSESSRKGQTDSKERQESRSKKKTDIDINTSEQDAEVSAAQLLANRIENYITEKKPQQTDILRDMVNELFKVAQESPIEGQKAPLRNKYELLKAAIANREVYRDAWEKAKWIVGEKYKGQSDKLELLDKYFENEPRRMFANKTIDKVINDAISKNKINVNDFINADSNVRKNLVNFIMDEAGFKGNDVTLFSGYLDSRIQEIQKEWEQKRLERTTLKTHEQQIKYIGEMIKNKLSRPFAFDKVNDALKKALTDNNIKISEIAKNYYTTGKVNQKAIVDYFIDKSGLQGQDADLLRNYLYQRMQTLRKEYNAKFIEQLLKDKPKSYNKKTFVDRVMELINTGALQNDKVKDLIRLKYDLPVLENSDIQAIIEKMKKYDSLTDGQEKEDAYREALQVFADKLPVSAVEKVVAWRRMAMLLNTRTWMRNIGGNQLLKMVYKGSDTLAQLIELSLPIEERTKAIGWAKDKALVKTAQDSWELNKNEAMMGSRWQLGTLSDLQALKPIFKNNKLNKLSEFSYRMLEAQDAWFIKAAYIDSMGQFMKARGLTEVTEDAVQYAIRRSQEMTFRDPSKIADIINKTKRITGIGLVVETLIPFVKTPINITNRAIEYSLLGLGKMAVQKDATRAARIESSAKAITGTGIMALGMLLSLLGYARAEREPQKNVEALKKSAGEMPNSIITPWGSYTFDWGQPVAAALAMGISIMESIKSTDKTAWEAIYDAVAVGGDSILNQSVLQNIKSFLGGYYSSTSEALMSIPGDFLVEQNIPSSLGAIARSIDSTKRASYGDGSLGIEKFIRQNAAKIPGVSLLLEPEIDVFGNEVKQGNVIEQFLSPGLFAKKSDDPVYLEVIRVYKTAGKDTRNFLPSGVDNGKFSVDKVEYKLTPKEYTEFKRSMGKAYYNGIQNLMKNSTYKRASDTVKANMIAQKAVDAYNRQKKKYARSKK
jgi:disulfide oxidoreductase YuzD